MEVQLINEGTTGTLVLHGRLDSVTSLEMEPVFQQVTDRFEDVVLDLTELNYVASAGLRLLKKSCVTMRRKGGTLVLKNVNKTVMEVLEITGFVGFLQIE